MNILLLGEYSNVHHTLAEGLRALGHSVTVVSNGDFWKDYPRDINLARTTGKWGGIAYMARLYALLPRLCGYDVVQLINPMFLELRAERIFPIYRYLRRHNGRVFLGAFGMDYYWVHTCCHNRPFRYSDFNIGETLRTDTDAMNERHDWIGTSKERLNRYVAEDCDGIIAGLYEYWACYHPNFPNKTCFIPFPLRLPEHLFVPYDKNRRLRLFIGINRSRNAYKGTDILLEVARETASRHPDSIELIVAENVPFVQYEQMMDKADVLLDQLYSYTPSMNTLLAMSKGIVCVGGGEPENYKILGEDELRPIINVLPYKESVCEVLERLATGKVDIARLQQQSIEYVNRHHDYIKVAQTYLDFYQSKM